MDREEFLNLTIDKQIEFFNSELMNGKSISKISKNLGISRGITSKFKRYGYILKNNEFKTIEPKEICKDEIKVGRPKKNNKSSKHTVIFDDDVWTDLRIKSIKEHTTASEILEDLAINFLYK
ncbi:hypothetical protein [Clostridium botulinum]|uniref:Uncharacterized protein n=2 Tax=Clostridium botulinum TaxID=1491 RepID=X5IWY4_CLOBO|nr:hypothetical protein [Clostridium botulinum]APC82151.1 hypothetical protein NPD12_3823 [Clostridium botulinum]AXG97735.1 hypothetical protein AGE31_19260 [Clostridium botulinum]EDT79952.1 conserved hypothetical protein [Clostridium botulinum NCTC 2916]MBY6773818.1 hypothetical protein [Clostridium botulinum]MBY6777349.1 hypothetical protein [Clostridium botulinum]